MEALLSPLECRLVRAHTADEALLALLEQDFAAIVLDIRMPGMSGIELADLIKTRPRSRHVPILFLTAHMFNEKDILRGYGTGAVDYLVKPIHPTHLVRTVRRWLTPSNDNFTVLVVDDDAAMREIVERTLRSTGYQVATASNGQEGLQVLEAKNPGLIVLDLMMPEMDGFEFLRRLKENPRHGHLPVVVATAKELTEAEHKLLEESATRVIQKVAHSRTELMHIVERQVNTLLKARWQAERPLLSERPRRSSGPASERTVEKA